MLTDRLNEERLEHALGQRERERERDRKRERERLNFYACKGAHTLFTSQRERER